jgi:hypothetical protein
MSSIRSASSSTSTSIADRSAVRWPEVVEQAAGRGHQDVGARAQRRVLRIDVDAAEDHRGGERQVLAVGAHRFLDLGGEFAGGHQHEAARLAVFRREGLLGKAIQDRQGEAGGLASAGLGGGKQIAALQHQGNALGLDGGGGGVAGLGHGPQQGLGQAEFGEFHGNRGAGGHGAAFGNYGG